MRIAPAPARPRWPRWVCQVVGLCLATTAVAAEPPAELRKLHALLIVDTLSGLGESVKVDGERVEHLLSNNLPKDRVEIRLLTGKDVNADAIMAYYRDLKVGPDDALFFYYAGHGATDPSKGHFLALQELEAKPLLRSDLRRAMLSHHPGLAVLLTDCCSTRFKLPGKSRSVYLDAGSSDSIHPVLRCLLYQSRGVVDITASTGNASYGDDHDGGIFTRTLAKLVEAGVPHSDEDRDGFVSWPEFFAKLQGDTQGVFITWAQRQRARGEHFDQTSQRPFAFELGGPPAVQIRNETLGVLKYQYRWAGQSQWQDASVVPRGVGRHVPSPGRGVAEPVLQVRFEGEKTSDLHVGKTYKFHDTAKPHGGGPAWAEPVRAGPVSPLRPFGGLPRPFPRRP